LAFPAVSAAPGPPVASISLVVVVVTPA